MNYTLDMRGNKESMMNLCNWVTCGTFTEIGKSPISVVGIWFWVGVWGWDQEYILNILRMRFVSLRSVS